MQVMLWRACGVVVFGGLWGATAAWAADASNVEKCSRKFGTLTVVDPRSGLGQLQQYGLGSPAALLRMMVQQSGCFDVVERGVAMQNLQQERALAAGGELRSDSNVGQGQMQAADFVMTPDVQLPASTTGGASGGMLGGLGKLGALIGSVAGNLQFKEATTSLLIADVRSSIQVAGAEGKSSKTDFNIGGWALGAAGAGALGAYSSSPEGKLIAASLLDNYNKIVASIRDRERLIQPTTPEATANAQGSTRAEAPQPAGQMLTPKIANVKVFADASRDSSVVATLSMGEQMVASGEARNGFVRVDAANFSGWVQRTLVGPVPGSAAAAPPPVAAVQPSPLAPVAMTAPRYRYGAFNGTVDGADTGRFRIIIDDDGRVSGDGSFSRLGAFGLNGKYDPAKGELVMMGGSSAGGVWFVGRFDPSRGAVIGSWNVGSPVAGIAIGPNAQGGSFNAQQQQQ